MGSDSIDLFAHFVIPAKAGRCIHKSIESDPIDLRDRVKSQKMKKR